ncbi:amidohydrolase family protein [Pseudonocardia ailaonensis]|uniref:Amidohydrolase family protein n=1 Tax=Pseudonocardia ailaonensis TaxID=367279 RepID=A0ABN2N4F6_9PSEU
MSEVVDTSPAARARGAAGLPYMIVSTDDHAGPKPSTYLREYCPADYLDVFDAACLEQDALARKHDDEVATSRRRIAEGTGTVADLSLDQLGKTRECAGHHDVNVRLRDMDADGITAQVIFAGGQNDTELPWVGFGWNAGPKKNRHLREVSYRMWNHWLSDYISPAPERLLGVMQIPIWDVDAAIRELHWGAERGLHVVNLHAPREDYEPYTNLCYDPFWAACEEVGATLATHAGASAPYARDTRGMNLLYLSEFHWYGNRGLTQLILGGVFERFPRLKLVMTEQRVDFAPGMIRHLDSLYHNRKVQLSPAADGGIIAPDWPSVTDLSDDEQPLATLRSPGEYWRENCYLSGSFLAPFEVAQRHDIGLDNLLWGADYPHCEGTWPDTDVALRNTFGPIPEDDTRQILGENAVDVYHLDRAKLRAIADRIGPRPEDLREPVDPGEIPAGRSWAFREQANFT